MSVVEKLDIQNKILTTYVRDDGTIAKSALLILRAPWFSNKTLFTQSEEKMIYDAVETLYRLESQGVTELQLQERAKALLGQARSLHSPRTMADILSIIAIRSNENEMQNELKRILDVDNPIEQQIRLLNLIEEMKVSEHIYLEFKDILPDLAAYLKYEILTRATTQAKKQLRAEMLQAGFDIPGTSKEMTTSLSVGIGLARATELSVEAKVSFKLEVGDNGKIKEVKGLSTSLSGKAGASVLTAKAKGKGSKSSAQTYADIDAWLDANEQNIANTIFATLSPYKAFKTAKNAFLSEKEKQKILKKQSMLQNRLIMLGLIEPGDILSNTIDNKPKMPLMSTGLTLGAGVGLSVGFSRLGAGVSYEGASTKTTWTKHEDLSVVLRDHPDVFFQDKGYIKEQFYLIHARNPQATYGSVQPLVNWSQLNNFHRRLCEAIESKGDPSSKEDSNKIAFDPILYSRTLYRALEALEFELLEYANVVNQLEVALERQKSLSISEQAANQVIIDRLQQRKKQMEYSRVDRSEINGSNREDQFIKNRGQFFQSMLMSYSMIRHTLDMIHYAMELDGEPIPEEDIRDLEKYDSLFSHPSFRLKNKHHKALMVPKSLKGSKNHEVYTLNVLGQSLAIEYLNVSRANNLDDEGEYLVITVPKIASSWLQSDLASLFEDFESMGVTNEVLASLQSNLSALGGMADFVDIGASRNLCFVFVRGPDGLYHMQYKRETQSLNLGGKGSGNVYGALTMGGGIQYGATKTQNESIGNNTLTYIMTRLNGLSLSDDLTSLTSNEKWCAFRLMHDESFKQLILNLANQETNIHEELMTMLNALDQRAENIAGSSNETPLRDRVLQSIAAYTNNPSNQNFEDAMGNLEELFYKYHRYVYNPVKNERFNIDSPSTSRSRALFWNKKPVRKGITFTQEQAIQKLGRENVDPLFLEEVERRKHNKRSPEVMRRVQDSKRQRSKTQQNKRQK